jgi:ATP-dependent helicase Lhr and Lhr-like helicase
VKTQKKAVTIKSTSKENVANSKDSSGGTLSALERFSPITSAWFRKTFDAPTPAQEQGWNAIASGEHTLVLAPTGSGKTLAAFLWALDRLHANPSHKPGVRVLYISPLKALIYDVERNLRAPLVGIAREAAKAGLPVPDVSVASRTGDTPAAERRALVKTPPDILVTTPESLYLLLSSQARSILSTVEAIVIDEIHALAPTKRGAHMALSLERLEQLIAANPTGPGKPPQRIGLSATQRPLEEVARFLGGRAQDPETGQWKARPVTVVDTGVRKVLDLQIVVPVEDMAELGKPVLGADGEPVMNGAAAGDPEARTSIWPAIYPQLLELIRTHTSTLVFVNSRRLSERLANKLNELAGEELVRSHHGSIAREQRLEIEELLKAGKLPALVATSSLELGIDMGAIDLVIQVEAPSSVASGLQRIGRAGHQVGEPSKGRIFPKFRGDLVSAAVVARRMFEGLVEETRVPKNPIDVLCQQIVAMVSTNEPSTATTSSSKPKRAKSKSVIEHVVVSQNAGTNSVIGTGGSTVEAVTQMARGAYPFADISDDVITGLLDLLSGRYPSDEFAELRPRITWDRLSGVLSPRPGSRMLAVTSGGTIPDRGLYTVTTPEGTKVGELDEEMVFESRVGETFLLGATTWRIEDITPDRVVVTPAPGVPGKMPFWHGDKLGRPFELGKAIGEFVRTLEHTDDETLATTYALDPLAVQNMRAYVEEEREATGNSLPTDRQIVVQRFRDELGDWQLCILSPFGAQVHAPWAMAIEARIRNQIGMDARAVWSDDGIIIRLPEADEAPPSDYVLIDPDELDELLVAEVGNSALFAARFRENAARALLLPRRRPGTRTPLWKQRQKSADLLKVASRYGSFPILLETYRECLRDAFDVPALHGLLSDIRTRKVRVVSLDMVHPSPFASSLAFGYIANFMYDGDAPLAERRAAALALDRDMLAELLGAEELRELLDARALAAVEDELQCLDPRRHARTTEAVHDLLRKLGDLSSLELAARCEGGETFSEPTVERLIRERRVIRIRVAGEDRYAAAEDAGRYREAVGAHVPPGLPNAFLEWTAGNPADPADPLGPLGSLLVRYARTHGPFTTADVAARFGVDAAIVDSCLLRRGDNGAVLQGEFRPNGSGKEWCDADVLRSLRQRSLAVLRKEIEPTATDALARFLPDWHGVGSAVVGGGVDRLYEVIGQLQGYALPASVLERDIFPARLPRYTPRLFDELLTSGEIVWVGAGSLGRDDGKVRLYLRDQAPLLVAKPLELGDAARPSDSEHERLRELLGDRGACFFREMQGRNDMVTIDALWDLVWAGEVTNDSFNAVRAMIPNRKGGGRTTTATSTRRAGRPRLSSLSALGPPKVQGRWSLVTRELGLDTSSLRRDNFAQHNQAGSVALSRPSQDRFEPVVGLDHDPFQNMHTDEFTAPLAMIVDPLGDNSGSKGTRVSLAATRRAEDASKKQRMAAARADNTQRLHATAITLLERHGVLTREAIKGEGILGGFAGLYPVLKMLEEGGRVRRGYFVAGMGGAQFAVPGAVDRLRALREPPTEPEIVILAAVDPANAFGHALPWPVKGPQRAAGAYVLLVDGLPSLYLEKGGRGAIALRPFDDTWEAPVVKALAGMVGTEDDSYKSTNRSIRFNRLILENVPNELVPLLKANGFVPTPKGLAKYA